MEDDLSSVCRPLRREMDEIPRWLSSCCFQVYQTPRGGKSFAESFTTVEGVWGGVGHQHKHPIARVDASSTDLFPACDGRLSTQAGDCGTD